MNLIQFALFLVYVSAVTVAGAGIIAFLDPREKSRLNRTVFLGEACLFGNIFLIGLMMTLSFSGFYGAVSLWSLVAAQFLFLFNGRARASLAGLLKEGIPRDIPFIAFFALLAFFVFRNLFFLVDIDSHSTYLYTQKLWLNNGTSLIGSPAHDIRIFIPQFDALPYGFGLSVLGNELLFPMLVNLMWRGAVLLLVFGYVRYRWNSWYGLAAAMFILFNDHFYYSGANACCVINGAVMAFLFAGAFRFWEGRRNGETAHIVFALIHLSQFMNNKYQMAYIFLAMFALGFLIQQDSWRKMREIVSKRRYVFCIAAAFGVTALWYLKNWLVTGLPTFPIFAGQFQIFNWHPEQSRVFMKILGGLDFMRVLKYLTYLFVWPGVKAAKIVVVTVSFLPILLLVSRRGSHNGEEKTKELYYWLGLSLISVIGIGLAMHQDPRYYRYPLGLFSVAAVLSLDFIAKDILRLRWSAAAAALVVLVAAAGFRMMFKEGGTALRPTFQENWGVLTDQLHTAEVIDRYFPANRILNEEMRKDPAKFDNVAWDFNSGAESVFSITLAPWRPQLYLWYTTVVRWESYTDERRVAEDLREMGVERVVRVTDKNIFFMTAEEFARKAVQFDRFPDTTYYNYGFPRELSEVKYRR